MFKLVIVLACISALVAAHSEQFHKFPVNGARYGATGPVGPFWDGNETYLQNVHCIVCDGTNAEAYWSRDEQHLTLQRIPPNPDHNCDTIYTVGADGSGLQLFSPQAGRDTCSYFSNDGSEVYYSSTRSAGLWCPPIPDPVFGYTWPLYPSMGVYVQDFSKPNTTPTALNLFQSGYTAELTLSPDGTAAIFTSDASGDLELYSFLTADPSTLRRITYTPGYDGGAYFSNKGDKICWRAYRPQAEELTNYLELIQLGLVVPVGMQLYVAEADGSNAYQVAQLNGTNFAPFFLPDDSGLIFSSNMHDPFGGNFQLYAIKLDGSNLTQITTEGNFNSFPMFSPSGKLLAFASDRNTTEYGDINIVLANWLPPW